MGKITAVVSDSLEDQVRSHIRRRGDISKIVSEALEAWCRENKK